MTDRTDAMTPRVGDVVARRFRVVGEIARGAWSTVYKAYQSDLDRFVALKIMHPESVADGTLVERFRREALFASQLTHPNTVSTFDYGATERGLFFIAMEILEGRDLLAELRAAGPFDVARALTIAQQVLRSLTEIHGLGLVHRDLKPENIMLCAPAGHETPDQPRDFVKLLDFGIAMATERLVGFTDAMSRLTRSGRVVGTPLYMSPEQLLEEPLTPATDIYGLGHILYEMLVGRAAFDDPSRSSMDTMLRHLEDEIPDLPGPLDTHPIQTIIRRATRKHPRDRYPDARAMLEALSGVDPATQPPSSRSGLIIAPLSSGSVRLRPGAAERQGLPGRRHELAWVEQHLAQVRAFGQSRILVVEGPSGIGKSRLVDACVQRVLSDPTEPVFLLRRHNHPRRDIREGGLWSDVSILLGLEDAGEGSLSIHLRDALREYSSINENQISVLLKLLRRDPELHHSLEELKEHRRKLFDALRKPFLALGRDQLFVWVLDDLHDEDPLTLAFLDELSQSFDDSSCRLLVLGTVARDEIDHSSGAARMLRPLMSAGPPAVYTLKLGGVARADAAMVLSAVLDAPPGVELAQSIREVTHGHPQFMIELLNQLRADGHLSLANGAYQMLGAAPSQLVAPHLAGLVGARIDAEAERSEVGGRVIMLLELVALLGGDVPRRWCRSYLETLGDKVLLPQLDPTIDAAVALDFLHEPHEQLAFCVPLAREVLLKRLITLAADEGGLGDPARLKLMSAARFLHRQWQEPTGVELKQIVRRFVAGGDPASAIRCLRHAADVAYRSFQIETALDNYLRASRLAADTATADDPEGLIVLLRLGEIHGTLGDLALAEDYLSRAKLLAEASPPSAFRSTVRGRSLQLEGELAVQRGDYERALVLLELSHEIFLEAGDDHGVARVITEIAHVRMRQGEPEAAMDPLLEALVLAELVGSVQVQTRARLYLARVRQQLGDLGRATRDAQAAIDLSDRDGNLVHRADALVELGQCLLLSGRPVEAVDTLREGIKGKLRVRDRDGIARCRKLLAVALAAAGDLDGALGELEMDIALARERQDIESAASTGVMFADLLAETVRRAHPPGCDLSLFARAEGSLGDLARLAERRQAPALYARAQTRRVLLRLYADAPALAFGMLHSVITTVEELDPVAMLEASMFDGWCVGLRHSPQDGLTSLSRLLGEATERGDHEREVLGHALAADLAYRVANSVVAEAHIKQGLALALRHRLVLEAGVFELLRLRVREQVAGAPQQAEGAFVLSPVWSAIVQVHPELAAD